MLYGRRVGLARVGPVAVVDEADLVGDVREALDRLAVVERVADAARTVAARPAHVIGPLQAARDPSVC